MIRQHANILKQGLRRLVLAKGRPFPCGPACAFEATLEQLADRLERTELALLQEQHRHQRTLERMAVAEAQRQHLQVLLAKRRACAARIPRFWNQLVAKNA